ncbi:MAG: cryptic protein cnp1 [Neisseria sp.]|uniref:CNP1-like family protein n=1 Tax=Neisseria sp. TaxID=192066 RepID=UPI001CAFF6C6|nr:CNP1-like family protein [Neisseria sp.]MBF1300729.1 cryptic protein cnp1 [Neisseria sp.]
MRRFALLALSLAATQVFALGFSQKDTLTNTRYQESPEEVAAREFKEHKAELPPLPDTQSGDWFDLYVNETYGKQPKILLSSLQIMPAPDNSIRYVLNVRSDKGYDNLSVEGLYCARTSFTYSNDKRSSYKVFAYGDTVNRRWIEPRKGDWKLIGNAFSRNDALHTALYQAFCIDGMPTTVEGLVQRLKERGGRHGTTLTNHDK